MKIQHLTEITSSGSIATRSDRHAEHEWRRDASQKKQSAAAGPSHAKQQIDRAKAIKASREKKGLRHFARKLLRRRTDEATAIGISDVLSRLKGLEQTNTPDAKNTVTYGVEDEEGNIMKITVKSDQADSFEQTLGAALGELEDENMYGKDTDSSMSLAELLYNLKNEFDIVDVEFPEIPSDVVYNADKATYGVETDDVESPEAPMGGDEMGGMEDEMNAPSMDATSPDTSGMGATPPGGDMSGDEMGGMEDDLDSDMGEDFPEDETAPPDEDSIYQGLIKMFTAQADAEKAKAEAEAEKARAIQAEYSAKSANLEMERQEELARMDAELDRQKKNAKEAKRVSDLAKFRVQSGSGKAASASTFEGVSSFIDAALGKPQRHLITEDDDEGTLESVPMLQKQLNAVKQKWQPNQNDPQELQQYKQQMLQADTQIIQLRIKKTRLTLAYNQKTSGTANQQQQQQSNATNGAPSVMSDNG